MKSPEELKDGIGETVHFDDGTLQPWCGAKNANLLEPRASKWKTMTCSRCRDRARRRASTGTAPKRAGITDERFGGRARFRSGQ